MNGYCNGDAAWHREQHIENTRVLSNEDRGTLICLLALNMLRTDQWMSAVIEGTPGLANMSDQELLRRAKEADLEIYKELHPHD